MSLALYFINIFICWIFLCGKHWIGGSREPRILSIGEILSELMAKSLKLPLFASNDYGVKNIAKMHFNSSRYHLEVKNIAELLGVLIDAGTSISWKEMKKLLREERWHKERENINEYVAMCDMIDHYTATNPTRKPLFIADRGFVSFNVFAHAIENNAYFLVRAREANSRSMLATLELPDSPEFDIIFERWLTKRNTKTVKASPEIYKKIANRTFDYLEPKSQNIYYISFRVVSFLLPNGNTEIIYTNLPREDFSSEELRELYNMRWGIETSFRDIKYAAGLLFFHSRKKELVVQEIYAKLILYNFCELITGAIVVEKKDLKYTYKINFSIAIAICTEYLRRSTASPPMDVVTLISRELVAVRPGRSNPRYLRARTATTFQYR